MVVTSQCHEYRRRCVWCAHCLSRANKQPRTSVDAETAVAVLLTLRPQNESAKRRLRSACGDSSAEACRQGLADWDVDVVGVSNIQSVEGAAGGDAVAETFEISAAPPGA